MNEYKVIFHIDEISKWRLLLGNVNNLLDSMNDEKVYVQVLANSEAVKYYDPTQDLAANMDTMKVLNKKGVSFVACNNALRMFGINRDNLLDFIEIVPAGVVELVKKQREGFAYIKP